MTMGFVPMLVLVLVLVFMFVLVLVLMFMVIGDMNLEFHSGDACLLAVSDMDVVAFQVKLLEFVL
jgi:hypothetical protein